MFYLTETIILSFYIELYLSNILQVYFFCSHIAFTLHFQFIIIYVYLYLDINISDTPLH